MNLLLVMLKKELRGNIRTHKLIIVIAVFFVFGLGTPLMFKYLPLLVPADEAGIELPEFTTSDIISEYFSTIGQFGLVAVILIAMGSVSREREWGTAAMTLSKPVSRGVFITAKFLAITLVFELALCIGSLGFYMYMVVLFETLNVWRFLIANLIMELYLLVCISITIMYSSFCKSQLAAAGLSLVTLITVTAISAIPFLKYHVPGSLTSYAHRFTFGNSPDAFGALVVSICVVILALITGWRIFKTKEL